MEFPRQIYKRFLIGQLIPVVVILISSMLYLQMWSLLPLIFLVVLLQAYWGYRTFLPMARILGQISSTPSKEITDEPDEWFELQSAIGKLKSKIGQKEESSEGIFETALQALQDAILVVDTHRRVRFWNSALLKIAHRTELEMGEHLEEVFRHPDILKLFHEADEGDAVSGILDTGHPQNKSLRLSVVPIRSHELRLGAVGIFSDLTEMKKNENMRIDFVANVSHELRTPLTSLKGYAQAMESVDQPSEAKKYAGIILKSTDRLINLVDELLDLSQLESGTALEFQRISTRGVTETVLNQLQGLAHSKQQNISLEIAAEWVYGDKNRIEQVLSNLLQNAIKYSPEKSKVEIIWTSEGESQILIVRDNGPGIDEEHLPRLFERFYRVEKSRSSEKGGTGLGLAIVKHIMQRHGGSVQVESKIGHGTTFRCSFRYADTF